MLARRLHNFARVLPVGRQLFDRIVAFTE